MSEGASKTGNDYIHVRFGFREWLGAVGDVGTFFPLFLNLVALNGLPPVRSLLLVGLIYMGTAVYFRLPVPVQPLKAMAAITIAGGLGMHVLSAGGLWMGGILLLLAVTGRIDWFARYFTRPIVKGIQLAVGLMLLRTSLSMLTTSTLPHVTGLPDTLYSLPGLSDFFTALVLLVIPQLPMTLGNSIYAVSDVARDYFGEKAKRVTNRNLTLSIGIVNVGAGVLGGLPCCHGSSGMTAHYRFGARTAGATIIMGGFCFLLALCFSLSGGQVTGFVPPWVFGLMLVYIGVRHSLLILRLKERQWLAVIIGLFGLLTRNLTYAIVCGLLIEAVLHWRTGRISGSSKETPDCRSDTE